MLRHDHVEAFLQLPLHLRRCAARRDPQIDQQFHAAGCSNRRVVGAAENGCDGALWNDAVGCVLPRVSWKPGFERIDHARYFWYRVRVLRDGVARARVRDATDDGDSKDADTDLFP